MKSYTLLALITLSPFALSQPAFVDGFGDPSAFNSKMTSGETCAAEALEKEIEKNRPKNYAFKDDPYQLKKIQFQLLVMDLNDDGEVSTDEIRKVSPRAEGYWNKYDLNANNRITGEEVKGYIEKLLKSQWRRKFKSLDRKRDGKLSRSDLHRIYYAHTDEINIDEILSTYDIDHNGEITISEYMEASKAKVRDTKLR